MSGPLAKRFREIEGVVWSVDADGCVFQEGHASRRITIPLACIENPDDVHAHDNWISVSRNFLKQLEAEGKR